MIKMKVNKTNTIKNCKKKIMKSTCNCNHKFQKFKNYCKIKVLRYKKTLNSNKN